MLQSGQIHWGTKASADFINQKFEDNKALFSGKTLEEFKKQESEILCLTKDLSYLEAYY